MLASEYHWSMSDILWETGLDDVFHLQDKIRLRRLDNTRMKVIIQHHGKPEELIKSIENELAGQKEIPAAPLDKSGLEGLKNSMATGRAFNVK